jgi:hypothetical protein
MRSAANGCREGQKGGWLQHTVENLARPAFFHFIIPAFVDVAITNGSIDEPAKVPASKFPGGTLLLFFGGAFFYFPAGFAGIDTVIFSCNQKIQMSFHRRRDGPPSLFITVDRF